MRLQEEVHAGCCGSSHGLAAADDACDTATPGKSVVTLQLHWPLQLR